MPKTFRTYSSATEGKPYFLNATVPKQRLLEMLFESKTFEKLILPIICFL